jgi:hypothetical protein
MTGARIAQIVAGLIALAPLFIMIGEGYERRRAFWSRASWLRWTGAFTGAVTVLAMPVIAEVGIVLGYYSRSGMSTNQRSLWVLGALSCWGVGSWAFFRLIHRFAHGDPREPFTFALLRQPVRFEFEDADACSPVPLDATYAHELIPEERTAQPGGRAATARAGGRNRLGHDEPGDSSRGSA